VDAGEVVTELPEGPEKPPLLGKRVMSKGQAACPDLNGSVALALAFVRGENKYDVLLPSGKRILVSVSDLAEATAEQRKAADKVEGNTTLQKDIVKKLRKVKARKGIWTMRRIEHTELENPQHELEIIGDDKNQISFTVSTSTFQCVNRAPPPR
jgi:hypothetical protein